MSKHSAARWIWDGPPDNIHVLEADRPHMRVCFLTSNGPTVERANLIAAAPELLEALKDATLALALLAGADEGHQKYLTAARAVIAKAEGRETL